MAKKKLTVDFDWHEAQMKLRDKEISFYRDTLYKTEQHLGEARQENQKLKEIIIDILLRKG